MPSRRESQSHGRPPVSTTLMVAIAGTIAVTSSLGDGDFDWGSTMVGIVLILVLHAYDPKDDAGWWLQSAAFSAVWALCVILIIGFPLQGFVLNMVDTNEGDALAVACWGVLTAGMTLYRRSLYKG